MIALKFVGRTVLCVPNLKIVAVGNAAKGSARLVGVTSYSSLCDFQNKVKLPNNARQMLTPDVEFKLSNYDCFGFDLDNTICRYKLENMVKLEYNCLADYLINVKGFPPKHLRKPLEENVDFMMKGLILDVNKGNILHLSHKGNILRGCHGTKELTQDELKDYYGPDLQWQITNDFTRNPLCTWNGPLSNTMRTLLDYFDMPAGLIFARAVDSLDEQHGGKMSKYNIYPYILDALHNMFNKEHFQLDIGGYFPTIKADPDKFIHKCSTDLLNWFHTLKKHKKVVFLITGSNVDFASHTASNSLGPNWRELFDLVICFAKKPGFFTENRSFIEVNGFVETTNIANEKLKRGGVYTYGNWDGVHEFLKKATNKAEPKVVYIGDNLIQDVYTPNVHSACDTIAICEEMEAEGICDYGSQTHFDNDFLLSKRWGSFFTNGTNTREDTIWKEIIQNNAKLCVPSLEYLVQFHSDFN